jgi:hypothetical protein
MYFYFICTIRMEKPTPPFIYTEKLVLANIGNPVKLQEIKTDFNITKTDADLTELATRYNETYAYMFSIYIDTFLENLIRDRRDLESLMNLIQKYQLDIDARLRIGESNGFMTLFTCATAQGKDVIKDIADYLLSKGADINAIQIVPTELYGTDAMTDYIKATALMYSIEYPDIHGNAHLEKIRYLLSKGAKIQVRDKDGTILDALELSRKKEKEIGRRTADGFKFTAYKPEEIRAVIQLLEAHIVSVKAQGRNIATVRQTLPYLKRKLNKSRTNNGASKNGSHLLPENTINAIGSFLSGKTGYIKEQNTKLREQLNIPAAEPKKIVKSKNTPLRYNNILAKQDPILFPKKTRKARRNDRKSKSRRNK